MSHALLHADAGDAADAPSAPADPRPVTWRHLARLCRQVERGDAAWLGALGPQALPAVKAMRRAQAAWRDHRRSAAGAGGTALRPPPLGALRAAATAAAEAAQRMRARPAGFFLPGLTPLGPGLLLNLPQFKDWLHRDFVREAAVPPDAPPERAAARAREVLLRQCLSLSGVDDSLQRRHHLLQLLRDHGHDQPLLELVRRAGKAWLPLGWAGDWEAIADTQDERRALDALRAALGTLVAALDRWCASLKPVAPVPAGPAVAPVASAARGPGAAAAAARSAAPLILQAARLPRGVIWAFGGAAVLAVSVGLVAHLTAGNGATDARWAVYHVDEADGVRMAIDPDSIRRDGRLLTYRVGLVWTRENKSAVAVFTGHCGTGRRRIETVQHYRGLRFETATLYEVRGTPAGEWPDTGVDVALLRAACAQP